MNLDMRDRLGALLRELRGERSQRQYAPQLSRELERVGGTPIGYSALRSYEESESEPSIEVFQVVAQLKGWNLDELMQHLRTGSVSGDRQIGPGELKHHVMALDPIERIQFFSWLADLVAGEVKTIIQNPETPTLVEGDAVKKKKKR